MKIVFFGTSNVALPILETLNKNHQIVAVVTSPDAKTGRKQVIQESPISVLAGEMGLKILKPEKVKNNPEIVNELKNLQADIFIVVSYGYILPDEIINLPTNKTLNIHFSLLPKYRGASPIQAAILNNDTETGSSIFILDDKIDHGTILSQEKISIDIDDNFITLGDKLARMSAKLILKTLDNYQTGKITPIIQNDSEATFTSIIKKDDGKINWHDSADKIYNQFRAFYPWPGIWTTWEGKKIKILDCKNITVVPPELENKISATSEGLILEEGYILCGNKTILQIYSLQIEGKNATRFTDFTNGYKNFIGSKLT